MNKGGPTISARLVSLAVGRAALYTCVVVYQTGIPIRKNENMSARIMAR
jgi:hypothetical protein